MNYICPNCETSFKPDDKNDPLPATCPECGADLYPEELLYQQMISEPGGEVVPV